MLMKTTLYFGYTRNRQDRAQIKDVHETKEISENIYIDIDAKGNLVGMTIEHAKANANLWEFSFQEMVQQTA